MALGRRDRNDRNDRSDRRDADKKDARSGGAKNDGEKDKAAEEAKQTTGANATTDGTAEGGKPEDDKGGEGATGSAAVGEQEGRNDAIVSDSQPVAGAGTELPGGFFAGEPVKVVGLLKMSRLNNEMGKVLAPGMGSTADLPGTIKVKLHSGTEVAVKPENLERLGPPPKAAGVSDDGPSINQSQSKAALTSAAAASGLPILSKAAAAAALAAAVPVFSKAKAGAVPTGPSFSKASAGAPLAGGPLPAGPILPGLTPRKTTPLTQEETEEVMRLALAATDAAAQKLELPEGSHEDAADGPSSKEPPLPEKSSDPDAKPGDDDGAKRSTGADAQLAEGDATKSIDVDAQPDGGGAKRSIDVDAQPDGGGAKKSEGAANGEEAQNSGSGEQEADPV